MKRIPLTLGLLGIAAVTLLFVTAMRVDAARLRVRTAMRSTAGAPSCTGSDASVADRGAPHGMYVWNPYKVQGGKYERALEADVIGKDPTLCGVSLVVSWSAVEPSKGTFDWSSIVTQARPYTRAGLRVNLLFADASEVGKPGSDAATPKWVFTQDGVAKVQCPKQPAYPDFINAKFEDDWATFIATAAREFSDGPGASPIAKSVGYMRFGIGAGVEAYPGHIERPNVKQRPCYRAWVKTAGWTYAKWVKHSKAVVRAIARAHTDKQMMVALNYVPYGPKSVYAYANAVAAAAAPRRIGFGTENLGIGHVADPSSKPGPCNPQAKKVSLYWCQAFRRHAGKVPLEFQPIAATTPGAMMGYKLVIGKLLQYAIANHAQILEMYPQQWVAADAPAQIPGLSKAESAQNRAALDAAARVLGAHQ